MDLEIIAKVNMTTQEQLNISELPSLFGIFQLGGGEGGGGNDLHSNLI